MKRLQGTILALVGLAACEGPRTHVTKQDAQGNYVTTSDYEVMERTEFKGAMRDGLADFDEGVTQLRDRANELGGESLSDFSEWAEDLQKHRTAFVNQLKRSEAALIDDWPDQRAATLEAYYDMRGCLDEAFDEVLDA